MSLNTKVSASQIKSSKEIKRDEFNEKLSTTLQEVFTKCHSNLNTAFKSDKRILHTHKWMIERNAYQHICTKEQQINTSRAKFRKIKENKNKIKIHLKIKSCVCCVYICEVL